MKIGVGDSDGVPASLFALPVAEIDPAETSSFALPVEEIDPADAVPTVRPSCFEPGHGTWPTQGILDGNRCGDSERCAGETDSRQGGTIKSSKFSKPSKIVRINELADHGLPQQAFLRPLG